MKLDENPKDRFRGNQNEYDSQQGETFRMKLTSKPETECNEEECIKDDKKRSKKIVVTALIIIVCIAFFTVSAKIIIPSFLYNNANKCISEGKYVKAYEVLISLNGYKDSASRAAEIRSEYVAEKLKNANVGDYIVFGAYEQDNKESNGKEDIEWLVLDKEGNKLLVISRYSLDCREYNNTQTAVTWETCSLRKWLNETFIVKAFNADEQNMIQSTTVTADKNPEYDISPGNDTNDKVFLLSITEVTRFFSSDRARRCSATEYAKAQGAYTNRNFTSNGKNAGWWWLRSPGHNSKCAADVHYDGSVFSYGIRVDYETDAVRPALWIDIGSLHE
jgi:hypothetical protein